MDSKWAEEQLQVIRTLMERSAVYRRALAPIMLSSGLVGILTMAAGLIFHLNSMRQFCGVWLSAAVVAVVGAFFIARRQAFRDHEPFWSAPTRRVALALSAPLAAGMCLGLMFWGMQGPASVIVSLNWILFYGCALHAAGFFMSRGMRLFGWLFIIGSCSLIYCVLHRLVTVVYYNPHWFMGFFFGGLHLAYGAYLYLTEKGKNAA